MSQLPPEQVKSVAGQVLKTWWFWPVLVLIVWTGLLLVERVTRYQETKYQQELAQTASNQLAQSIVVISNAIREQMAQNISNQLARGMVDVSNQIAAALHESKIQGAIQTALTQQASQMMQRNISPAASNFQARLAQMQAQAQARLDSLTNVKPPAVTAAAKPAPPKEPDKPKRTAASNLPTNILFDHETVTKEGTAYVLTVYFRRDGTGSLGILHFMVGAYNQLRARIVGIDTGTDAAVGVEKTIDTTGLEASLNFSCPDGVDPVVKVYLSDPTVLQVVCDALREPVTAYVAMNQPKPGGSQ